jgi:glutaredoxin
MFCDQAKEYLSPKGLAFQERDIALDPCALADLKKLGCMTTPVIVIDYAVIVGFDSAKIDKLVVDSEHPWCRSSIIPSTDFAIARCAEAPRSIGPIESPKFQT